MHAFGSKIIGRLRCYSEERIKSGSQIQIIKTDDRDVLWYTQSSFTQQTNDPNREHIIGRKNSRWLIRLCK
ncbi:hypothetical protein D3C76_1705310 [compost metagenome]